MFRAWDFGLHLQLQKQGFNFLDPLKEALNPKPYFLDPLTGFRDVDPLGKVPLKRARSRVKKGPL